MLGLLSREHNQNKEFRKHNNLVPVAEKKTFINDKKEGGFAKTGVAQQRDRWLRRI
jgi:hypothetical protein